MPEQGPGPGRAGGGREDGRGDAAPSTAPDSASDTAPAAAPAVPRGAPGASGTGSGAARDAERAARLLGHLRDLARARRRPARDLAAHDRVHWLAELPGEVYVEADAGPGDVLFSVPVIPLAPPAVLEEFDGWLALRHWYRVLRELAERAAVQGDDVVLATGLLGWRPPGGPPVHDHLLSTPVRVVVDERTERVDVVLAGHTTLRDRELLSDLPQFRPVDWVSEAVQSGQGFGLNASVGDVLRKWCATALAGPGDGSGFGFGQGSGEAVPYREDWAPGSTGAPSAAPRVRLAPALVARPPGRAAVSDYCTALIGALAARTPVPAGLAALLAGTPQVRHLDDDDPGTVRDLLTGVLVRGLRVLVATSGTTASEALRAALPAGIAALTAADPGGAAAVADAVRARAAEHDPARHAAHVAALAEREEAAAEAAAALAGRLRDAEATGATDLGAGYRGGRGELDARLRAEAPELSWLPVLPDMPPGPPISRGEAAELVMLLAEETPERRARLAQRDVDPGELPSVAYVRTLIEAEAAAAERARRSETDLSRRLGSLPVESLTRLDGAASAVTAALRELGLDGHPGSWNPAGVAVRAFGDGLAHRRPLEWTRVADMAARAEWAERAVAGLAGHSVEFPPGEPHLRRLARAAQDLRNHLADGGTLKRGPLRSSAQRQAEALLAGITVDGAPPATAETLDLVFTELMVRMTCQELQYAWEAAGVSFPADRPPADRVARFVRAHARLARVRAALAAVEETRELLDLAGRAVPLNHPLQWHGFTSALGSALEDLGVDRAAADLDALRDSIGPVDDSDPPELGDALAALAARDASGYGRCLTALAVARHERALQVRCADLLGRVRAVHPGLADLMAATDGDPVWRERTLRWDDAWAWARASGRFAATVPSEAEERLRGELAEAEAARTAARAELTSARAWGAALARPVPAGAAAEAVPAWILPLWRIPETLPPRPDSFDVVIVAGEHGAGAEALFLLWLAPRVILAGPPGPDLPEPEGSVPTLPPPGALRDQITPVTPLFTLLTATPATVDDTETESTTSGDMATPEAATPDIPHQAPAPEVELDPGPEPEPEPRAVSQVRRGRSIAEYKRPELVELVGRIAAHEPDLTDEQIVELAERMLGCPEDEALLVGARLRYAVEVYRSGA